MAEQLSLLDYPSSTRERSPLVVPRPAPAPVTTEPSVGQELLNPEQPISRTRALQQLVAVGAGLPVRLVVTDNRHTLLSWRPADDTDGYVVRVHHMFLDAPAEVGLAMGRYVANPRRGADGRVIDQFIAEQRHLVTRDRRTLAPPVGRYHDLQSLYDQLNDEEFNGCVDARIGWGEPGSPRRRARRTIQLGSFDPEDRTIVIHPALDQDFVPSFFVASVVFHEMLHEQVPATQAGDRRCVHSAAFRARENAFPLTARALQWEKDNVDRLLKYRPEREERRPQRRASVGAR
ncbi:MAG: hypothetical protein AB2A00_40275 [Myxococcota bacterium]